MPKPTVDREIDFIVGVMDLLSATIMPSLNVDGTKPDLARLECECRAARRSINYIVQRIAAIDPAVKREQSKAAQPPVKVIPKP